MESILERNEEVLLKCSCRTEVSNMEVVENFVIGILSNGFAGRGVHDFIITLTNKRLYVEGLRYDLTSSIPDVSNTLKCDFKDIKNFSYEISDSKTVITLEIDDKKKAVYKFILKDNEYLGIIKAMKEYIEETLK